jgi:hypothetical protein
MNQFPLGSFLAKFRHYELLSDRKRKRYFLKGLCNEIFLLKVFFLHESLSSKIFFSQIVSFRILGEDDKLVVGAVDTGKSFEVAKISGNLRKKYEIIR